MPGPSARPLRPSAASAILGGVGGEGTRPATAREVGDWTEQGHAFIHRDHLAGDAVEQAAAKGDAGTSNRMRIQQHGARQLEVEYIITEGCAQAFGINRAAADGVDAHALRPQVQSEVPAQRLECRLRYADHVVARMTELTAIRRNGQRVTRIMAQ